MIYINIYEQWEIIFPSDEINVYQVKILTFFIIILKSRKLFRISQLTQMSLKRAISDKWLWRTLCWEAEAKPLEDSPCKQVRLHHSLSLFCLLGEKFKLFNERITHTSTPLKKINWYFPVRGLTIWIWPHIPYCYWCCDQQSKVA